MKKYLPYIIFIILMIFITASMSFSEMRLDVARDSAKRAQESCLGRSTSYAKSNYCICMRDYSENVNAPHSMFDRLTFGYFWSKKEALEKYSNQYARCQTGKHTL